MPIIQKTVRAPTAGIKSLLITKPINKELYITSISVRVLLNLKFGIWRAYFLDYDLGGYSRISLCNKIFADADNTILLFEGKREWPDGFDLYLAARSQEAGDEIYYTITYTIVEPKKKRWGE